MLLYGNTEDENDNLQPTITDFWSKEHNEALSKPKQDSIDQSLLKMFVCCGVPFVVVEHPFFIEMFKKTCPGYILPSREKLSGIILSHMTVRIEEILLFNIYNFSILLQVWMVGQILWVILFIIL